MRVFFLSSICWWLASTGLAQSQFELDVGSRLVSGVYENAPYSLRIRAPEGFRIQGRAESGFDDPYRVATLVYKLMPVIVCAVAVQPSNVEAWIENQRQIELDSAKGGEPEDIEMEVGGTLRKGLCIRYETGMISTYYGFFWYQGGVSYSIHTSFVRGVDEAIALERLKTALAAIEVLEGEERSRMIRSFHRANPTQVVMRPDVAIRRGRVYDFELGLVWTMPNGYWRVDPRKRVTGRFVEPFAAFELKSGALILLGLRSAPGGVDHPELHRLGLLARSRVRHARRRSKSPSPWNAKHIPGFLMSKIVWGDEDQPSGTLYATALVGDRVVEASLVGQVPEMRSNSRQLDEFLHGLQILDEPPVDLIIEEGRLECLRWGLAVDRLPDGFGTWVAADDVDPLEVMRLSAAGTSGKVTASAFPASGAPGEVKEILDRLIEEFQGHDDSGSDAAQIDRGWTTINDRRVEGFRVRNGDRFVEALALNDLGILYVLRMEGSGADLDSIRRALRWLD